MSKKKLFWKILGWSFLAGVVILVVVVVLGFFMFDTMINHPICDSAEEVVVMMEEYVDYDFDSDDYEVREWWCWGAPDLQKGVTLVVKDERAWREIVRYFRGQKKATFKENYKTITIENDKDSYRKHCEWNREDFYDVGDESFVLNYRTREIEDSFNEW